MFWAFHIVTNIYIYVFLFILLSLLLFQIEEQMASLSSTLSLTPDDVENRIYFMKVIESLLKPFFGDIKIQLFGSTLNGFGFKGCDLDMSFETFTDVKEKVNYIAG